MTPFDLSGKNILISGAASGIGRQCAISCGKMGATVILMGRDNARLEETLSQMDEPSKHLVCRGNLTDFDWVTQIVEYVVREKGRLHGLLNCAGISATLPRKLVSKEKLEEYFTTNVFAAYHLTQEVCKVGHFDKNGGSIVFFSSVMGCVGEVGKSLYGMTKGALVAGMRSLACELAKKSIRVNTVSPGVVITPINEHLPHIANPEKRKILEEQHLLGLGRPEDVANACIYLLSDASRWVTGTNLVIDGGYTAR